jgi:hypothetical protein
VIHFLVGDLLYGYASEPGVSRFIFNGTVCVDNSAVDEQHPGFFFQRHLPQKILDAYFGRLAGIFVNI